MELSPQDMVLLKFVFALWFIFIPLALIIGSLPATFRSFVEEGDPMGKIRVRHRYWFLRRIQKKKNVKKAHSALVSKMWREDGNGDELWFKKAWDILGELADKIRAEAD